MYHLRTGLYNVSIGTMLNQLSGMNRRQALQLGLGSLAGFSYVLPPSPEVSNVPAPGPPPPRLEGHDLQPVAIDPALVIRTITGLRPFRPSGFVVRRSEHNGKSLIHNYGHGGGGFTLSWGCANLALELAGDVSGRSCAVIGGGVMGLSTARLLLRRGADVCLYTDALPPTTTSNIAGAQCWPVSVYDGSRRTEAFGAQFIQAANFSFRYFQDLVGPRWGVRWVPNYYLSNSEPLDGWMGGPSGVLHGLQIGFRDFGPGEHVFPTRYARRFHTMLIEPATYLDSLLQEVIGAGARLEIRRFQQPDEILQLPHTLLFNCTGLGAKALFGDEELTPIKGQLSILLPQPGVDYNIITNVLYMFPRSDGIVLGGSYERGNWDLATDSGIQDRVIRGHQAIFDGLRQGQQARG